MSNPTNADATGVTLVYQVVQLHRHTVQAWHHEEMTNPYTGLLAMVCRQHQFNFLLWHEEDLARSPDASDYQIAQVKRVIDQYNQQRNDWIERVDEALLSEIRLHRRELPENTPVNTETPGSGIDRLSIMALRIYHYEEQLERGDAGSEHLSMVEGRLEVCRTQHADLSQSLVELLDDVYAGRKQFKLYRQLKMYNDPSLNPFLYERRRAG